MMVHLTTRNMRKKITLAVVALVLIGFMYGYYQYNRPIQSLVNATPDFKLSSTQLVEEFGKDEIKANQMYLGKILQIEGEVIAIESSKPTVIILEGVDFGTVRAEMNSESTPNENLVGQTITIKGSCSGFLLDVILNECVLIKK